MSDIEEGKTYEVECPFVRSIYEHWDEDNNLTKVPTWHPGVDWEMSGPDDLQAVADGVGSVTYNVISVHALPKPYHTRIFFVRQWIDPDGKQFGKRKLMIFGIQAFRRRIICYKFGGYEDGFILRQ